MPQIDPSDVAIIVSQNAGVIGTLQVDGHDDRFLLFVPDRPAPESISHEVNDDMQLIVMELGTLLSSFNDLQKLISFYISFRIEYHMVVGPRQLFPISLIVWCCIQLFQQMNIHERRSRIEIIIGRKIQIILIDKVIENIPNDRTLRDLSMVTEVLP